MYDTLTLRVYHLTIMTCSRRLAMCIFMSFWSRTFSLSQISFLLLTYYLLIFSWITSSTRGELVLMFILGVMYLIAVLLLLLQLTLLSPHLSSSICSGLHHGSQNHFRHGVLSSLYRLLVQSGKKSGILRYAHHITMRDFNTDLLSSHALRSLN